MIWYRLSPFLQKLITFHYPPFENSLDNSDYMRNGDYFPNRLEAQQDAGKVDLLNFNYFV